MGKTPAARLPFLDDGPIDAVRSPAALLAALDRHEPVSPFGGSRRFSPAQALARVRPALRRIGITRVGNISHLSPLGRAAFQATRPWVFTHTATGQNSSGQGRGPADVHAEIGCIMEAVEGFCAEPRNMPLVRASYAFVRHAHRVIDPRQYRVALGCEPPSPDEPLMWTRALSLADRSEVLVPAECVYFPFFPLDYGTRPHFPSSSNGLAAGSTYIEALLWALYEVIERHYWGCWELERATAEALYEPEFLSPADRAWISDRMPDVQVQLFALSLPEVPRDLPMVVCALMGDATTYLGFGCAPDPAAAVRRAVTEAAQAIAINASGAREDIARRREPDDAASREHRQMLGTLGRLPRYRTLRASAFRARSVAARRFSTLGAELRFVLGWLRRAGMPHVFAANLTRIGVEIPVVRAIVPGAECSTNAGAASRWTTADARERSFGIDLRKDQVAS